MVKIGSGAFISVEELIVPSCLPLCLKFAVQLYFFANCCIFFKDEIASVGKLLKLPLEILVVKHKYETKISFFISPPTNAAFDAKLIPILSCLILSKHKFFIYNPFLILLPLTALIPNREITHSKNSQYFILFKIGFR